MSEDLRCCGSGVCIINDDGECWCGQRWDGEKMCRPTLNLDTIPEHATVEDIRYFEDKVNRNPWDKKAQLQLAMIKKHFGIE